MSDEPKKRHWNYRIIAHTSPPNGELQYGLHEVHYDESGEVDGITESPIDGTFDSPAELVEHFEFMLAGVKKAAEKQVVAIRGEPSYFELKRALFASWSKVLSGEEFAENMEFIEDVYRRMVEGNRRNEAFERLDALEKRPVN